MVDMGCPIGYLLPPGCLYSAPSPCMLRACLSNLVCPFAVSAAVGTGYPKENATVKARGFGCGNSAETQDQSWTPGEPRRAHQPQSPKARAGLVSAGMPSERVASGSIAWRPPKRKQPVTAPGPLGTQ
jgi:hypothetical protein